MELTPKQKAKLLKLASLADDGELFLLKEINSLEEQIEALAEREPEKGEKGDAPSKEELLGLIAPLIPVVKDGEDGAPGENYVLTEKDKKEIAKSIEIPVVEKVIEKTEVIKEQPIEIIKEVENPVTGAEIVEKVNDLRLIPKLQIDIDHIKGFENSKLTDYIINRALGIVDQRTSFLINKVSNLQTQVNNIPAGGSSGVSSFNSLTGAITLAAGTNITLTPVGNTITIDATGGGGGTWGTITGTLSDQTDLQNELNAKLNASGTIIGATSQLQQFTSGIIVDRIQPIADGNAAIRITDAGGTSDLMTFGISGGSQTINIVGATRLSGGSFFLSPASSSYFGNGINAIKRTGFGGVTSPTAQIHMGAGIATANGAPLKFTAGTNLSTTEAGAIEYDGTHLYFTATNGGARFQLDQQDTDTGITQLTGDVTAGPGSGSQVATLATVNANVGSFGSSTSIPSFTVNAKGLITAASGNVVIAPAGTLTGTVLNSTVVTSSLVTLGTLTSLTVNAATITLSQDTNFVLSGGVNGVSFDGTTLSVDATNDRVGIGTAAPTQKLEVLQNVDGHPRIQVTNPNTGSSATAGIRLSAGNTAGADAIIWKNSNTNVGYGGVDSMNIYQTGINPIAFLTNDLVRMTITGAGNIGIGIAPTAVMHLKAGTATANTGPLKFTAGTNLTTTEAGAVEYDGTHLYFSPTNSGPRIELDQPMISARVWNTIAQAIVTATFTAVTFDSERWDTDTMHSTSSNTSRLTATTAGLYEIGASILLASSAATGVSFQIWLNGSSTNRLAVMQIAPPGGGLAGGATVYNTYSLAAGDYVELMVYHNAGVNVNTVVFATASPEFWMTRLGPRP